jgi:hypothetical protein
MTRARHPQGRCLGLASHALWIIALDVALRRNVSGRTRNSLACSPVSLNDLGDSGSRHRPHIIHPSSCGCSPDLQRTPDRIASVMLRAPASFHRIQDPRGEVWTVVRGGRAWNDRCFTARCYQACTRGSLVCFDPLSSSREISLYCRPARARMPQQALMQCLAADAACALHAAPQTTHSDGRMRARQLTACVRGHVGKVSVRRRQKSSVWYLCHSAPAGDSETRRMVVSKRNVFCELVIGA